METVRKVMRFTTLLLSLQLFFLYSEAFAAEGADSCMKAKVVDLGGQEVAYYESKGKGDTVVLVHGNSVSSYSFEKQLCGSLGDSLHLVALDLPGHGRSSDALDPSATYNLPGYAGILSQFVQNLGIEDSVFAGWSLGGHILLEARTSLPLAKGIMIFGTPPLGVPPAIGDAFLMSNPAAGLGFQSQWDNGDIELYISSLFAPGEESIPDFFYRDARRSDGDARFQLLMSVGTLNYTDEIVIAQSMNIPLAIVHGETDQGISLDYIDTLNLQNLWGGKIHVIKGAGHAVQWEASEMFDNLLRAFVQDISK